MKADRPFDDEKRAAGEPNDGQTSENRQAVDAAADQAEGTEGVEGTEGAEEANVSSEPGGDSDDAPGAALRTLACLEGEGGTEADGARRGVQKRDFLKKYRFELAALGGFIAWDALSSTYGYGGAVSFFLSEDFGFEALVVRSPMQYRLEQSFTSFAAGERHFQPGAAFTAVGAMLWSPVHAKLRWNERRITHADLMLVAGAGRTFHDSVQGITLEAGIGLKLYLSRFFSMRFDVRDLLAPQEVLGRSRLTHNIGIFAGFAGWVPG